MKQRLFLLFGLVMIMQVGLAQTTGYHMNVKMNNGSFFSVHADSVAEVYFTTTEEKQFTDTYYIVSGKTEKGPFMSGSTVTIQPLDPALNAIGTQQTTMTFDDCGSYGFRNILFKYPYVQISVRGIFFNELTDYDTSNSQVSLKGYADLQNGSKVNVNVVTHLISERVVNLVIGGMDLGAAISQAQGELLTAFGLQRLNDKNFSSVSITDGDDYAAALLAISKPLLYNRTSAELTSILTRLLFDFADDGQFTEQNMQQFVKDRDNISFGNGRLIEKYKKYGLNIRVKKLAFFYDWDGDGVAGNEVYDPAQPVTCDNKEIHATQEGGTFKVNIDCLVPLFLSPKKWAWVGSSEEEYEVDGNSGDVYSQETTSYLYPFIVSSNVSLSSEYENGVLTITVAPTEHRKVEGSSVTLYDTVGRSVISINVSQDGNPNGPELELSGYAGQTISAILNNLQQSHARNALADINYTGLWNNYSFKAPLTPDNYQLYELFSLPYRLLFNCIQVQMRMIQEEKSIFAPMFHVTNALAYYELITLFGDVPYLNPNADYSNWYDYRDIYLPRTSANEIFSQLINMLNEDLENAPERVTGIIKLRDLSHEDALKWAKPTKDIIRVLLANIYMYQGNYTAARPLLQDIVGSGRYSLMPYQNGLYGREENITFSPSLRAQTEGGDDAPEIILALEPNITTRGRAGANRDINQNFPIFMTYGDVLLSLAECESKLGNDEKAQEYLGEVKSTKSIETTAEEVIPAISEVRNIIQSDFGGYFAFLKRTGLALSTLGLEEYQLLFPIPREEIMRNPSMTQNPGY